MPRRRVARPLSGQRLARRDGEDRRLQAQQALRPLADEGHLRGHLVGAGQQVGLVQDDHDLLAPAADALHEGALALAEGAVGRGDEQDEVGARHEAFGQRLVFAQDGVRAGRVHDREHLEQRVGVVVLDDGIGPPLGRLGAVAQERDGVGRGRDALRERLLAEQGIDERRLAGVELAQHDDQEEGVEVGFGLAQHGEIVRRGLRGDQGLPQRAQRRTLVREQRPLALARQIR